MKVAFATSNLETIDVHFGGAKQFALYNINSTSSELIEVAKLGEGFDSENKVDGIIDLLKGTDMVYFVSIGGPAAAKVINAKMYPMKIEQDASIEETIKKLQAMMGSNPPPWIKKILESEVA